MIGGVDMSDAIEKAKENNQKLISIIMGHCAVVLSDIYKLERWDINKFPGIKDKWMISVQGCHSEKNEIMMTFNFVLTTAEITSILDADNMTAIARTGKFEYDQ